jgi:hypothetical protein
MIELFAKVIWQGVNHTAGGQERISSTRSRQGPDGSAHRLGLGPAALARPLLQPGYFAVVKVNL